jgi:hypothetical protein
MTVGAPGLNRLPPVPRRMRSGRRGPESRLTWASSAIDVREAAPETKPLPREEAGMTLPERLGGELPQRFAPGLLCFNLVRRCDSVPF